VVTSQTIEGVSYREGDKHEVVWPGAIRRAVRRRKSVGAGSQIAQKSGPRRRGKVSRRWREIGKAGAETATNVAANIKTTKRKSYFARGKNKAPPTGRWGSVEERRRKTLDVHRGDRVPTREETLTV